MKRTKNLICLILILFPVLITVSSCCTKPQIQTINPALSFAKVPDPIGSDGKSCIELKDDKVEMPFWYWQALVRYILTTEKVRKQYKAWNKINNKEKFESLRQAGEEAQSETNAYFYNKHKKE